MQYLTRILLGELSQFNDRVALNTEQAFACCVGLSGRCMYEHSSMQCALGKCCI